MTARERLTLCSLHAPSQPVPSADGFSRRESYVLDDIFETSSQLDYGLFGKWRRKVSGTIRSLRSPLRLPQLTKDLVRKASLVAGLGHLKLVSLKIIPVCYFGISAEPLSFGAVLSHDLVGLAEVVAKAIGRRRQITGSPAAQKVERSCAGDEGGDEGEDVV